MSELPSVIRSGDFEDGHIQGIAVDTERGEVYFTFTSRLLKNDFAGEVLSLAVRPGLWFPYGAIGIFSCGDGSFYFSHPHKRSGEKTFCSMLHRYRIGEYDECFELV